MCVGGVAVKIKVPQSRHDVIPPADKLPRTVLWELAAEEASLITHPAGSSPFRRGRKYQSAGLVTLPPLYVVGTV